MLKSFPGYPSFTEHTALLTRDGCASSLLAFITLYRPPFITKPTKVEFITTTCMVLGFADVEYVHTYINAYIHIVDSYNILTCGNVP